MKKIFLTIALTLFMLKLFSQVNYDKRLLTIYKKETLDKYMKSQPGIIRWQNFKVANMYKYIKLSEIKDVSKLDTLKIIDRKSKTALNKKISLPDEKEFNPYLYNIQWKGKEDTYYLVPDTNIIVKIFSRAYVISEYNKTLKK